MATDPTALFVGNIAWRVQWPEIKQLFSTAGEVVYVDMPLAPDQRSRGFGIVRFSTPEDARKAIVAFDGFELHGRRLQVREDQQVGRYLRHQMQHQPRNGMSALAGSNHFLLYEQQQLVQYQQQSQQQEEDTVDANGIPLPPMLMPHHHMLPMYAPHLHQNIHQQYARYGPRFRGDSELYQQPYRPHHNGAGFQVFVGNLEWSVGWQDIKDLAKQHGLEPVRSDIAIGFDGKSRGWGTLAFTTMGECTRAMQSLNGLEYKGRAIEVREDRKIFSDDNSNSGTVMAQQHLQPQQYELPPSFDAAP